MDWVPTNFGEIAEKVRVLVAARLNSPEQSNLIAVEGVDGAGKTTFAAKLAAHLGVSHVELDRHLRQRGDDSEPFVSLVDLPSLTSAIKARTPTVVDGVMISNVLGCAEIPIDFRIYVNCVSPYGFWNYGLDLARGHLISIPGTVVPRLEQEIFDYHFRVLPHVRANLFFTRLG